VIRFLKEVGSDALPPELLAAALPLVPVCRRGRRAWEAELPFAELTSAAFPKLVVSGGHREASRRFATTLPNGSVPHGW
jgi:hypothetical protein